MKITQIALTLMVVFGASAPALAAPIREAANAPNEAEFKNLAGKEWKTVAPGVYRAEDKDGAVYRVGFGVGGMAYDRAELADQLVEQKHALKHATDPAELATISESISGLQDNIAALDVSLEQATVSAKTFTNHWERIDNASCGNTVKYRADVSIEGVNGYIQGTMVSGVDIGGTGLCYYGAWGWSKSTNGSNPAVYTWIKTASGATATASNPALVSKNGSVSTPPAAAPYSFKCYVAAGIAAKSMNPSYPYGADQAGYKSFVVDQVDCDNYIH